MDSDCLPVEILVVGLARSAQAKPRGKKAWKRKVSQSARAVLPDGFSPLEEEVTIKITQFYESDAPDVDNIIKPIQDALIGIVYDDDSRVARAECQKSRIDGAFKIKGVSEGLAVHLARGSDFVQIVISDGPNHEVLL